MLLCELFVKGVVCGCVMVLGVSFRMVVGGSLKMFW